MTNAERLHPPAAATPASDEGQETPALPRRGD